MSAQPRACATSVALGRRIRAIRKANGWSLRQLGDKTGVNWCVLHAAEMGTRNLMLPVAEKIAGGLGVDVWAFFALGASARGCPACQGRPPQGFTCRACGTPG